MVILAFVVALCLTKPIRCPFSEVNIPFLLSTKALRQQLVRLSNTLEST